MFRLMKGMFSGSQVYGIPHENSDLDLVIRMSQEEVDLIIKSKTADVVREFPENKSYSVRFGKLNLIICTDDEYFNAWVKGTVNLILKAPVTKEQAKDEFESKGITRLFNSGDSIDKTTPVSIDSIPLPDGAIF